MYLDAALRWIHYTFAIFWLAQVYFLGFVFSSVGPSLDEETRRKLVPRLLPKVGFLSGIASLVAVASGLWLMKDLYAGPAGMAAAGGARMSWISLGAALALVMFLLGVAVQMPASMRITRALKAGEAPDPGAMGKMAWSGKASLYLSTPVIFCMMLGAGHDTLAFSPGPILFVLVLCAAVTALFGLLAARFQPR